MLVTLLTGNVQLLPEVADRDFDANAAEPVVPVVSEAVYGQPETAFLDCHWPDTTTALRAALVDLSRAITVTVHVT